MVPDVIGVANLFMTPHILLLQELLLSYGFAQWDNGHDELTVGWGLDDAPAVLAAAQGKSGADVARCRRFALLASTALGGDMVALQTAMSLLQGGKLELTLTHASPMGPPGGSTLHDTVRAHDVSHRGP